MRIAIAFVGIALMGSAQAAKTPEQKLAGLVAGRSAGDPVDCILPEGIVRPEIIDGRAIVYRATSIVYVVRPAGDCEGLREGAQIQTSSLNGRLCRGEKFRMASPPGPSRLSLCTFGPFIPYRKAK